MTKKKSPLALPPRSVDVCRHAEVFQRIKPQVNKYVCGGCKEQLLMVVLQFALMNQADFEKFKADQVAAYTAARRQKETDLVTPDEVRREQQEKRR
jgi:hypothetical protein